MEYPSVVVRVMAAVYTMYRVEFVESASWKPVESTRAFVVVCPRPYRNGQLTEAAQQALLGAVKGAVASSGQRMCVVWSQGHCVYIEPDGQTQPSSQPPSGGIACLHFPIQLKPGRITW